MIRCSLVALAICIWAPAVSAIKLEVVEVVFNAEHTALWEKSYHLDPQFNPDGPAIVELLSAGMPFDIPQI